MAEEQTGPMTKDELLGLTQKLKELGSQLSPKERWFLNETLQSGIRKNRVDEVEGYTFGSALQGGTVYYPSSYTEQWGAGQHLEGSNVQDAAEITVAVGVVGHF